MTTLRQLAAAACVTLLTGCVLGPNYAPPALPPGAAAPLTAFSPAASAPVPPPEDWWSLYNDPVLDGLIAQAFAANEDLQAAEENLAASRAVLEGARSNLLFPQTNADFGATYGRDGTTDEILELTGRKPQTTWLYDSVLDASYELDLFGRVRRSTEAARDNTQAVVAARDDLRVTVAAETARAYGEICTLGEAINVAQSALALSEQQEQIEQQREAAGAASQFELLRQQVQVSQVRATLPPLQGERRSALFELTDLLGKTPAEAPGDVQACDSPPLLRDLIPVGDGMALLRRRPDVREADRQLAAALAQIGVAEADLLPRVTLNGFYGGASNQINLLGSNAGLTWGIGPAISWSFPNMAGPLARLAQARAQSNAALSHFDSVVLQALKETAQALAIYSAELDHHAALTAARNEATSAYAQARDQFNDGQISDLDLLTSEQTLIATETALAASGAALVEDQITVFKALGGGWQ